MASVELALTDDRGRHLLTPQGETIITNASSIYGSRRANGIGTFEIELPPDTPEDMVRDDNMVQVWYSPTAASRRLFNVYLIRDRRWYYNTQNREVLKISGPDKHDILRRRNVMAYPGGAGCKSGYVDDMIKAYVRDAFDDSPGDLNNDYGTRGVDDLLTVAQDTSQGPQLNERCYSLKPLLTSDGAGVLSELAAISRSRGTPLYYDLRPTITDNGIAFVFYVSLNQPGTDLTDRLAFSVGRENLRNPDLHESAYRERNYIFARGQGEGTDQAIAQQQNEARTGISVWARAEGSVNAYGQSDDALDDAAHRGLAEHAASREFYGDAVSVPGSEFGIDWWFGSKVRVIYHGTYDCVIDYVEITQEPDHHSVTASLRSER